MQIRVNVPSHSRTTSGDVQEFVKLTDVNVDRRHVLAREQFWYSLVSCRAQFVSRMRVSHCNGHLIYLLVDLTLK